MYCKKHLIHAGKTVANGLTIARLPHPKAFYRTSIVRHSSAVQHLNLPVSKTLTNMKRILFASLLLCGFHAGFAQCDKNITLSASKTEYLDDAGTVQHTADETTSILISKDSLVITPSSAPAPMAGAITSQTCNWTTAYKEGKSVIKAKLSDGNNVMNLTLTIEGKEGKVNVVATIEEMQGQQIRVAVDSFKEQS